MNFFFHFQASSIDHRSNILRGNKRRKAKIVWIVSKWTEWNQITVAKCMCSLFTHNMCERASVSIDCIVCMILNWCYYFYVQFFSSLWDVLRIFLFLPFSISIFPSSFFCFVLSYEANARTHIYNRKYFYCVAKINCVGIFFDVTQDWTLNESFWHAINNTKRKANQNKRSEIMHDIVGYWLLNIHSLLLLLRLLLLLLLLLLNAVCGEYVHHYMAQISITILL